MRFYQLGVLLFAASPLAAQSRPIAPRESALFASQPAPPPSPDTLSTVDTGLTRWQGGGIGIASGALLGAVAVALFATGDQCEDCSTNGEDKPYVAGIAIGAVLGMIVGTQWAGAR